VPYSRQLLNPGEEIAVDLHPHWWFFIRQGTALVVSVVVALVIAINTGGDGFAAVLRWLSILAVLVSAIWFGLRWVAWVTTHFVVTSDRVIFREGVLRRRGVEIPLGRVNNVLFDQSILERVIGAGDLVIESGGERGQQTFSDVRNPDRVQNVIHARIDARRSD
jgi:uncharacterized membrane protein YdbT with pleckstrin-like domain